MAAYGGLAGRLGLDEREFVGLFRADPADEAEHPGMTQLALRLSRRRNGVSELHGAVARDMWRHMFRGRARRADHARHERRAPPDLPRRHVPRAARQAPRRGLARPRGRPADVGGGPVDPRRGAVGGALRGARGAGRVHPRQAAAGRAAPRRAGRLRPRDRRLDRPRRAHARLRQASRHLQAALPPRPRRRPPARAPRRRPAGAVPDRGQGAPERRGRQGHAPGSLPAEARTRPGATHRRSSRTTTSTSRGASSPAATSGSTCPAGRWRRAGRAG